MDELVPSPSQTGAPRWRPIPALDRRVLGVLIEKAKTTPDAYPMSINALRSGVNQKNNRFPLMEKEIEDLEEALVRLRGCGAVTEVQGASRVARFRHHAYEWLGVDKVELAVMAELLLRGAQTEGELRGRAARMEPISDVSALRPVLNSLAQKGLVVSLTGPGRGHVLTHALYEPRELEKLQAEFRHHDAGGPSANSQPSAAAVVASPISATAPAHTPSAPRFENSAPARSSAERAADDHTKQELRELRSEVEQLRTEMARLRREVDDLLAQLR